MKALRALMALTLAADAPAAAAAPAWTPSTSPDGVFTVATPCSAAEVEAMRRVPASATGAVQLEPQARVLCRKGKLLFMAGVTRQPALPAGTTLFDEIIRQAQADPTAEGSPSTSRLGGRRAYVNRQQKDGTLAQTGFVQVDRTTVILLVAGMQAGSGLGQSEQVAMVDRFFGSVRVAAR